MKDKLTIYKLIILYFLYKVDFSLPNSILSDFILEKGYTNYFNIQQALSELLDAKLISVKTTHNSSLYDLSDDGKQTIDLFGNHLAKEIRTDIVDYLKAHKCNIVEETSIFADYTRLKQNEYIVTCAVKETGSSLVEVKLNVSTEKEAAIVCSNWKKKNQQIYAELIDFLMEEPDIEELAYSSSESESKGS